MAGHEPPPTEIAGAPPRTWHRLVISTVLGLAVMVGVFALLFSKATSYREALLQLQALTWPWLVGLVAVGIANIAVYPVTVLAAIPTLKYRHGFIEQQSGFVVSSCLPGGGAVALGTQYSILARYGVDSRTAAAAVWSDAIWTYLLTLGFPSLAVILLVLNGRSTAGYTTVAAIGAIAVAVSVIAITVVLRSDTGARALGHLTERLLAPLMRRMSRPTPHITSSLVEFREESYDLIVTRWRWLTAANLTTQLAPFVVLACAAGALGLLPSTVSWVELFAAYSIALILTAFPITPGGLGTVDAALVALLVAFGADSSTAVAVDLIWRLVWFLPQFLAGAVSLGVYALSRRSLA